MQKKPATRPTRKTAKPAKKAAAKTKSEAKKATASSSVKAPAIGAVSPRADHWLFKSEPDVFGWDDLVRRGARGEPWDGVKNFLARNNMRAMQVGDLAFFYHSNEGKEVVGICEVCSPIHPDPKDETGTWECVDVRAVAAMPRPVTLVDVKANPMLEKMSLVTSMRLSVQPVTQAEWEEVCRMGGLDLKSIVRS